MKIYIVGHTPPDLDTLSSTIAYKEFLDKSNRYERTEVIAVNSGKTNNEMEYVFDRFGVKIPKDLSEYKIESDDAFILVDHNEESQRHPSVKAEQIIEIVDHHKININFTSPIRLDVKPLGSTSTIIYEHFEMYGIKPSTSTAGLMLASILSDTQGLKSSTTTGMDSIYAKKLAKLINVDLDRFIFDLFKAKSDISKLTPYEIVTKDYKIFEFGNKTVFINQVETVEPELVISKKAELINEMSIVKSKMNVEQAYCAITDILKINSQVIYSTNEEKKIVEKAFMTEGKDNVADIGPKMSRKKDIAPPIESAIIG